VFSLRRPGPDQLAIALDRARSEQPNYDGIGGTLTTEPAGYRRAEVQRHIGSGQVVFDRAVAALDGWQAQRYAGVVVTPPEVRPVQGETVVQVLRIGPLWATAACRIVYRVETPDRVGFAYGSLSEHPVRGEEAFLVERDPAGVVRARIVVFSRPRHWLVRLGGPIGRLVQRRTAGKYADGIARGAR